jgi:hypothetical protein
VDTPSGTYVMARAPRFDWAGAGFPDGPSLDDEVADAVEYVQNVTWRKLDATMPVAFERTAARAVVLRAQQQVQQADADAVEAASDELFTSSSAGGASESRRAFSDYKSANEALLVNRWPALNDLLWAAMTSDAQAWWRARLKGEMPPVPADVLAAGFLVTEVAWDWVHASPYEDVLPGYHSTYLAPVDPGDLPLVLDPLGDDY